MEDRLAEGIEAVEGAAAEAAQRVRLIQERRNPPLLLQRREGNFQFFYKRLGYPPLSTATSHAALALKSNSILPQKVAEIPWIKFVAVPSDHVKFGLSKGEFCFDVS